MNISKFGERFTAGSGILQLMDDLGSALANKDRDILMLGGGNPSHIPQVQEYLRQRLYQILANEGEFERMIGNYDTPQGEKNFIEALVRLLNKEFSWGLGPENIVLTNGSQSSFFFLFNMFAGEFSNGESKQIMLPLAPEYIGYADLGLCDNFFKANEPDIEYLENGTFKYRVDFNNLNVSEKIGAICASRPTNPTGNVLTDDEVDKLSKLAKGNDIPLILDNAYGTPFPNIIYSNVTPVWNEHIILTMSLSKLGLPATRTGIVIAKKEVIDAVSAMNAIFSLAPGSIGAVMALEMVRDGSIIDLSKNVVKNYYKAKADRALNKLVDGVSDLGCLVHKPEGALFLWLWMKELPITNQELYERLKARDVLVVPGHYFFPGIKEDLKHKHECIRITYAQDDAIVDKGLDIIVEEVKKAYSE